MSRLISVHRLSNGFHRVSKRVNLDEDETLAEAS